MGRQAQWLLLGIATALCGCSLVAAVGIQFLYDKSDLPATQVHYNVVYKQDPRVALNLFVPEGKGWPVLLYAYGGGWQSGDKDLTVGGRDVYNNIGRFFANRGIGVAVINYRLQPEVTWRDQVNDVAD